MQEILKALGLPENCALEPFLNAEDGEAYSVWKVTAGNNIYVLKQAKEFEAQVYSVFLTGENPYAPQLFALAECEGKTYLLMEYIPGEDMRFCTREKLCKALDALIAMQKEWWEKPGYEDAAFSMDKARLGRIRRGQDLGNPELQKYYEGYLNRCEQLPKTLCHEDLLPFNVQIGEEKAVLIDWEYAGMQPYLSSFARLIAHGEAQEDAFFHMKERDRAFAIDYYYEHLVKEQGISYHTYREDLDYFLLYEYCEWIMLGIRYGDTTTERYCRYLALAKEHIKHFKEEEIWK